MNLGLDPAILLEFVEERGVDFVDGDRLEAQFQIDEHIDELLAVNELDGRHAVPCCFPPCFTRKRPGRDDYALVGPTLHCAPEVANFRRGYGLGVALALKQHLETDERIDLERTVAIDAAITGTTCDDDLDEARLPQEPLREPLEAFRREGQQDREKLLPISSGRRG